MAQPAATSQAIRAALASAIGNAVGLTAALRVIFALFLVPVTAAFGWSRGQYMGAASVSPLVVAVLAYPTGWLIDRYGARAVLVPGIVLFGLAEMALTLNDGSPLRAVLLWAVFGLAASTQAPTAYVKVISGWFTARRGLALGLALGGGGSIGVAVLPPLLAWIIEHQGWRAAYLVLGGAALLLGAPAMFVWLRDPPAALRRSAGQAPPPGVSSGRAMRSLTFWLIFGATATHQIIIAGVFSNAAAMLSDKHLSLTDAGLFLSLYGVSYTVSQFIAGWLMDRWGSPKVGLPFFIGCLLGVVMLHRLVLAGRTDVATLVATALVLGVGSGAELSLEAYYITRYFGVRAAGQLFGVVFAVIVLSAAIGGIAFGVSFDKTGSYDSILNVSEVVLAVGCLLIAALKPYVFPARSEEPAAPGGIDAKSGAVA